MGASHKSKASKTVTLKVSAYGKCNSNLVCRLSPTVKTVNDFVDLLMKRTCVAYVGEKASCKKYNFITSAKGGRLNSRCEAPSYCSKTCITRSVSWREFGSYLY